MDRALKRAIPTQLNIGGGSLDEDIRVKPGIGLRRQRKLSDERQIKLETACRKPHEKEAAAVDAAPVTSRGFPDKPAPTDRPKFLCELKCRRTVHR